MERTKEQCIEVIREACHKAVPALKELSFGCEMTHKASGDKHLILQVSENHPGWFVAKTDQTDGKYLGFEKSNFEIAFREPQLQHVLAAIKMKKGSREYAVNSSGEFIMSEDIYRYNYTPTLVYWNLSHGLYQQELPVLTFLAELLEKKN